MQEEEKGVKEEETASPAASTAGAEDTGAEKASSPESGATPKGADDTSVAKTYTQEEVNRIMHERNRDYASMKRDLEAYRSLGSAQDIQQRLTPKQAPAAPQADTQLDDDDKKFIEYTRKVMPELSRLGKIDDKLLSFVANMQQREEAERAKYEESSQDEVFKYCDSINAKDEAQKVVIRDAVAAVILNDQSMTERWAARDPKVVADAIKVLESTLGKRAEIAAKQNVSSVKAQVEKVQQPMPKGGVPAPISKPKTINDDERVDKAWAALSPSK